MYPEHLHLIDTEFLDREGQVAVYLLDTGEPILVDSGTSRTAETILGSIRDLGFEPDEIENVVITHLHLDHAGGAGYLADELENATFYCREEAYEFLTDLDSATELVQAARRVLGERAKVYGNLKVIDPERVTRLSPGDTVKAGDATLNLIDASGHAHHQLAIYCPDRRILFPADEAGVYRRGEVQPVSPPPNFNLDRTLDSLDRFLDLDLDYLAYPHFGLADDPYEKLTMYREQLQDWVDDIRSLRDEDRAVDDIVKELVEEYSYQTDEWDRSVARSILRTDVKGVLDYLDSDNN